MDERRIGIYKKHTFFFCQIKFDLFTVIEFFIRFLNTLSIYKNTGRNNILFLLKFKIKISITFIGIELGHFRLYTDSILNSIS